MRSKRLKKQGATVAPAPDIHLPTLEEARAAVFSPVDEAEVSEEEFEREWAQGLTAEEARAETERFMDALAARSRARNTNAR
jgi:hypothetical protein